METVNHIMENLLRSDVLTQPREVQVYHVLIQMDGFENFRLTIHNIAIEYFDRHQKNIQKARELYLRGKRCLVDENYDTAIDLFSKAIKCCPLPDNTVTDNEENPELSKTNLLTNCYRQRFRAFRQIGELENASYDRDQYRYLQSMSNQTFDDNNEEELYKWDAIIANEISTIETQIHENIVLKTDQIKGRYFAASEDIPSDTVVLIERPLSSVLDYQWLNTRCSNCLKNVRNQFWPCIACDEVVFCDRECADIAMAKFHRYECGLTGLLAQYGAASHLAYRLLTRVGCREAIEFSEESVDSDMTCKWFVSSDANRVDLADAYKAYITLFDHLGGLSDRKAAQTLVLSVYMAMFLHFMRAIEMEDFSDFSAFVSFVLMVQSLINKIEINSFQFTDDENVFRLGLSAMFFGSIFSHSCDPNVIYMWENGCLLCWTVADIKGGEELFVSYGPYYRDMSVTQRRKKLLNDYHFVCECQSCATESVTESGSEHMSEMQ